MIIPECFAATSYKSNGKLTADLKRLSENETALVKYEFFMIKSLRMNRSNFAKRNIQLSRLLNLVRRISSY